MRVPRWRVRADSPWFVMGSSQDEMTLASLSEGVLALAPPEWDVVVTGRGPEGFVRAVFELDATTAGEAAMLAGEVYERVLRETADAEIMETTEAFVERLAVARAPVGDGWNLES